MNFAQIAKEAKKETEIAELKNTLDDDKLPDGYDINENPELKKAYDHIKGNAPVVFLTGGAGTGKSTFIKYLKKNLKSEMGKECVVLAPTGVAAVNVGGQTIHSFFNFKVAIFENKAIKMNMKNSVIDHTDLIVIDEISMVHSWMLDHIDYALRLWCGSEEPFGGKQMLFIGDCFQLPPVTDPKNEAAKKFCEKWDSPFFFAAKVFEKVDVEAIQLNKIYRQKGDDTFIHILNRVRKCDSGYEKDIAFLNEKCFIETRLGTKNVPEECLLLTTKNRDADEFNTKRMHNLREKGAESKTFEGITNGKFNFEHFRTPRILELCIGAKVMVTKNIASQNLANGDMGKVIDFGYNYVDVEIKKNKYRLTRETWQSIRYEWDESSKTIRQVTEGSFSQIPLTLGWAVTIHKSQGLTLDAVAINAEDAWDSGQVYVALSRVKNLNGLLLCKKIPTSSVKTSEYVKRIYEKLFPESENENAYDERELAGINFDNSIFSIDKSEEITSVKIGGISFELYPEEGKKIQGYVKRRTQSGFCAARAHGRGLSCDTLLKIIRHDVWKKMRREKQFILGGGKEENVL